MIAINKDFPLIDQVSEHYRQFEPPLETEKERWARENMEYRAQENRVFNPEGRYRSEVRAQVKVDGKILTHDDIMEAARMIKEIYDNDPTTQSICNHIIQSQGRLSVRQASWLQRQLK